MKKHREKRGSALGLANIVQTDLQLILSLSYSYVVLFCFTKIFLKVFLSQGNLSERIYMHQYK